MAGFYGGGLVLLGGLDLIEAGKMVRFRSLHPGGPFGRNSSTSLVWRPALRGFLCGTSGIVMLLSVPDRLRWRWRRALIRFAVGILILIATVYAMMG